MSLDQMSLNYEQSYFVKYRPELKRFFKSEKTAIIFQQLEYWSNKYPKGFWKFFQSCDKHPQYREGDSWEEELGFARRVFLKAFSLIGTRYKSKSAYLKQSDPFQGKMYVSYYDRKTNRTYFLRNHSCVKQFISSLWKNVKKALNPIKKKDEKGHYRNDTTSHSFTHAGNINSSHRSTSPLKGNVTNASPSPETSKALNPLSQEQVDKNLIVAQNMLNIWNKITSNKLPLRSYLKSNLPKALKESFQGSLYTWEDFCLKVASSKFLMGEAPNSKFKAYLAWLIKPETVQDIKDNYYSLGDRPVAYQRPEKTFNSDEIQGSETWKKICEQLCHRLEYATLKSWFVEGISFQQEETSHPQLQCPTLFKKDWIESHYRHDLEWAIKQVLPHVQQVEIRL